MIAALAVLATLAAEALAFYTVGELLAAGYPDERSTAAVSPFTMLALTLLAFALPRAVAAMVPRGRPTFAVNALTTFVAVYGAFRIEFAGDFAIWDFRWAFDFIAGRGVEAVELPRPITGALLIVITWVRGTWRSLSDVEFESAPRQLAVPAGIVIIASVLGAASSNDDLIARGAIAFFAVALVALAFSQSALSGATFGDVRAGGVTTTLLVGSASAAILGVIAFGLVFGVFSGPIADALLSAMGFVLLITVVPIVAVAQWLVGLISLDSGIFTPPGGLTGSDELPEDEVEERGTFERSVLALVRAAALGVGVLVLVGIVLLFAGRWRRYRRRVEVDVTVSASGSLREDVGSLLGNLFRRRHGDPDWHSPDPIVRLYHRILTAAHELGHDRNPGETPAEFAPQLRVTFANPVTDDVTRALEADLYGSRGAPSATIEELENRWERRNA